MQRKLRIRSRFMIDSKLIDASALRSGRPARAAEDISECGDQERPKFWCPAP